MISIPFMVLAVVLAVVPLVVLSVAQHRRGVDATPTDMDRRADVAEPHRRELPRAA